MNNFSYSQAGSTAEALQQYSAQSGSQYIAGGTNLIDLLKYFLTSAETLVDLNNLAHSDAVEELEGGGVRLHAFSTNADTAWHPRIERDYPLLSKAIMAGASQQIRNMATNGGNLLQRTRCYYFYDAASPCNKRVPGSGCPAIPGYNRIMAIMGTSEHCIAVFPSDMCVALAALDAVVNVTATDGGRRSIPFADFHRVPGDTPWIDNNLQPGEIITSIDLPAKGFAQHYTYLKLRDRNSYAFALVSVAIGLELDGSLIRDARIALGGIGTKPWRVPAAEEALRGMPVTEESLSQAADIILDGAVLFEHNAFKAELARRAIIRAGLMALQPESQRPGAQPSL